MTNQEQQLISGLIDRVNQTRLAEVDPDAERALNDGLGRNANALYILAQTVLVQQIALDEAQRQLAAVREQAQQPKKATSFLGSIFGHDEPARPAPPPPAPGYQPVPGTGQQAGYGAVPYGQPGYGAPVQTGPGGLFGGGGQTGGFMRGALQTATGVAAGALAFEGIESLLHGFGSGGESRGFGDLGGGVRPEEVTNNYYGERGSDGGLSSDIEDRRGDSGDSLAASEDTGFGSGDDDTAGFADADGEDTSGSGFDDGSGADDTGGGDDFGGSDDLS